MKTSKGAAALGNSRNNKETSAGSVFLKLPGADGARGGTAVRGPCWEGMERSRTTLAAAAILAMTAAVPLRAESEAPPSGPEAAQPELRDWMRGGATQLAEGIEALRDWLQALGSDAGPALDRAQQELAEAKQRLDAEMPQVRETTIEMVDRLKSAAAAAGSALQDAIEQLRRRLQGEDNGRPKPLRT